MKKLMVLGAGVHQLPIIKRAHKMPDVSTVVVDKDPYAPGLKFADEIVIHSIKDCKGVLEAAYEFCIDGAIAPCADVGLMSLSEVTDGFNLKGIRDKHVVLCNNKENFYTFCRTFGINTPQLYDELNEYHFPCIVKPIDGVGSQGVYLLESFYQRPHPEELLADAATYSSKNRAIIQQYIKGTVFNVDLLIQDGKIMYYILHDEVFEDGKNNFGVDYFVYPSEYTEKGFELPILTECKRLIDALEIHDGNIAVEGIVSNVNGIDENGHYEKDVVYILEVNLRMSGNFHMETHSLASGRDWIKDGINVALGVPVEGGCHPVPHGWVLIGSEKNGYIKNIIYDGCIVPERRWKLKDIGDYVKGYNERCSSTDHTVLAFFDTGTSREEVMNKLRYFKNNTYIEVG